MVVALKNFKSFLNLSVELRSRVQEVQNLSVVHLKEHTSDLRGVLRVGTGDVLVEALAEDVLLLFGERVARLLVLLLPLLLLPPSFLFLDIVEF